MHITTRRGISRATAVAFLAVVVLSYACTDSAQAVMLGLDIPNTDVQLQIQLDSIDPNTGDPAGSPFDILSPTSQSIPLVSGFLDFDDAGTELNNLDGELVVDSPWVIPTLVGDLHVTGGHLTIGPAPNGPWSVSGTDVDLGGLSVILDGGDNTDVFEFHFGATPITFDLTAGTNGSWDGSMNFVIPTTVSDATIINLFGNDVYLIYAIGGHVAFTIPEPGSMILLGIACVAVPVIGYRRRRRRS